MEKLPWNITRSPRSQLHLSERQWLHVCAETRRNATVWEVGNRGTTGQNFSCRFPLPVAKHGDNYCPAVLPLILLWLATLISLPWGNFCSLCWSPCLRKNIWQSVQTWAKGDGAPMKYQKRPYSGDSSVLHQQYWSSVAFVPNFRTRSIIDSGLGRLCNRDHFYGNEKQ